MRTLSAEETHHVYGGMIGAAPGSPLVDASATRPQGTNSWGENAPDGAGNTTTTTTTNVSGYLCFNIVIASGCTSSSATKTTTTNMKN